MKAQALGLAVAAAAAAFGLPGGAAQAVETRLAVGDSTVHFSLPDPTAAERRDPGAPWSLTLSRPTGTTLSLGVTAGNLGGYGPGLGPAASLHFDRGLSVEAFSTYAPTAAGPYGLGSGRVDLRVDVAPPGRLPTLSFSGGASNLSSGEGRDYSASAGLRLRF